jgi:hypothetical protein
MTCTYCDQTAMLNVDGVLTCAAHVKQAFKDAPASRRQREEDYAWEQRARELAEQD